jgi:hypothetical protein
MYSITNYSKKKAKELNVNIKPSTNKNKKIDVFKDGHKIASIGFLGAKDYPTFIKENGIEYANKKRQLYRKRHSKDINNKNGNGFWANKILW